MLFQTCQLGVEETQILRKMSNREALILHIYQDLSGPQLTRALTQPTRPKASGKAAAAMHAAHPWRCGPGQDTTSICSLRGSQPILCPLFLLGTSDAGMGSPSPGRVDPG